jgi:hypothetical protein
MPKEKKKNGRRDGESQRKKTPSLDYLKIAPLLVVSGFAHFLRPRYLAGGRSAGFASAGFEPSRLQKNYIRKVLGAILRVLIKNFFLGGA